MASPDTDGTDVATETTLGSSVDLSSQLAQSESDKKCDSSPPSPELGMGTPRGSEVNDLNLSELEEQAVADAELLEATAAEKEGEAAAPLQGEEASLPRSRQTQQLPPESAQQASPSSGDAKLMTPAPTCPPIRRSARTKNTLIYDQKYHPMDDTIRPSQAAKRRIVHGEQPLLGSDSKDESSGGSASDVESLAGNEESDDDESPPTRSRRKKRARSLTPEPTRRSSRRRSKPITSYNTNIHPQDSDLKRLWACDGSKSSPLPTKQTFSTTTICSTRKTPSDEVEGLCRTLLEDSAEDSSSEPAPKVPESTTRHSFSPEPFVKHDDKVAGTDQALRLGIGCRYADPNVWPAVKGLPFRIFTERMEDQLSAEAEAASPFHCEDDNKENDVTNPELMPRPSPLDGISIIPASYYHRAPGLYNIPAHSSVASNAFYVHPQFEASPYGLGWNDGAQDMHNNGNNDCLTSDYMRILGSSEHLPRTSTPTAHCRSRGHNDVVTSSPAQEFESLECLR